MNTVKSLGDKIFKLYCREMSLYPLLEKKEEKRLATLLYKWTSSPKPGQRTRENGRKAREKLINSNLRLVVKIAIQYQGNGLDLMDMITEGNMGLMTAVDNYNPNKGAKISHYASFWIKQRIRRAISNTSKNIRIPVHAVDTISKIRKFKTEYESKNSTQPTLEEIARKMKISKTKIQHLMEISAPQTSINQDISSDGESKTFIDIIEDKKATNAFTQAKQNEDRLIIDQCLDELNEKEKTIIIHRFGLDHGEIQTLESIGKKFNLTRERIRQIQAIAIRKLRVMITKIEKTKA